MKTIFKQDLNLEEAHNQRVSQIDRCPESDVSSRFKVLAQVLTNKNQV